MARFLLAWELGANLGHASRLRPLALALKARGHQVTFVLRDVVETRRLLGPELGSAFQAPLLLNGTPTAAWTMADVLLSCGYTSTSSLDGLASAWKALIDLTGCDAVVADHAPTALLAARLAGVPALHIGHGFSVPPNITPLPIFRDWTRTHAQHALQSDTRALASVNAVLAAHQTEPLPQLSQLFHPEKTLLCTWPELDHYPEQSREPSSYCGPDCEIQPGQAPQWPQATGPKVFAYLRSAYAECTEVLHALHNQGRSTVCFFPDRATAPQQAIESPHIHFANQPVDMQQVLQDCALVVCHAGHATVAQALHAGKPCLLLPTQTEQYLLARQVEKSGAAANAVALPKPVDYGALIAKLTLPDGPAQHSAQRLAEKYASFNPTHLTEYIASQAEGLLPSS